MFAKALTIAEIHSRQAAIRCERADDVDSIVDLQVTIALQIDTSANTNTNTGVARTA